MIKLLIIIAVFLLSAESQAQYKNVMIGNKNLPNEPSIAINPKNTQQLVAGANTDNYYYSDDGGMTWTQKLLTSSFKVWGDPCIIFDTSGTVHYFHLSNPPQGNWIDRIVCQKSENGGVTWNDGAFTGLNGTKAQDKEWVAVDPRNNVMHMTWTQFDDYGSPKPQDSSLILYSRSADKGETWSEPKRINAVVGDCIDDDNTVEGATPAVGPNGEVYVAWAGPSGLVFQKSLDGRNTWLPKEKFIDSMPGGWAFNIPGIMRCNGLPITLCDLSNGPNRGTIYINWSDQRNGTTDTDIWFVKSTDGGETWSAPKRINDDNSKRHQFFTWMAIDQTNGNLHTVFYDRRAYSDRRTDVYYAVSKDGGETFKNEKISESPFVPNPDIFFGDYNNITAHNNVVRPIWTRLHNGQLSIWTALIDSLKTTGINADETASQYEFENYPNPFEELTYISFKLRAASDISLKIYDVSGQNVATIIDNKHYDSGKYVENFNAENLALSAGTYYAVLKSNNQEIKRKMIIIQ